MNEDPLAFVETPPALADWVAAEGLLTAASEDDRILYPGAGTGNIAAAVHRHCSVRGRPAPDAVAVEMHPERADRLRERFVDEDAPDNHGVPRLPEDSAQRHRAYRGGVARAEVDADFEVREDDFLLDPPEGLFDYIVANPPYTAYSQIDTDAREAYSERFETATGQFPLHAPFVEQMLNLLNPNGVLTFLAPFTWLTVDATRPMRDLIRRESPCTPRSVPASGFPDHQVMTVLTTVGRAGASWTGRTSPPSETRLAPTGARLTMLDDVLRQGRPDVDLDEAWEEYHNHVEQGQLMVHHRDRDEREEIDSTDAGRQQSLARWSA